MCSFVFFVEKALPDSVVLIVITPKASGSNLRAIAIEIGKAASASLRDDRSNLESATYLAT